jgi:hypothetical protein
MEKRSESRSLERTSWACVARSVYRVYAAMSSFGKPSPFSATSFIAHISRGVMFEPR